MADERKFPEYELAGIETIARGVCVRDGKLLVCRAKGAKSCYLPGGHVEFGETGRQALVREMAEETGLAAEAGDLADATGWDENTALAVRNAAAAAFEAANGKAAE